MSDIAAGSTLDLRSLWFHVHLVDGGPFLHVVAATLVVIAVGFPLWAIVHALPTPSLVFRTLDISQRQWIIGMVVMLFLGDFLSLLLSIYYLVSIRPRISREKFGGGINVHTLVGGSPDR